MTLKPDLYVPCLLTFCAASAGGAIALTRAAGQKFEQTLLIV
jgi:hypothetical protein